VETGSLKALHALVRRHLARHALAGLALWTALLASVVLLAGWVLAGPDGWRPGAWTPLLLDLVLVGGAVAVLGLWHLWRRRRLGDRPLARAMEGAAGLPDGSVLGILELSTSVPRGVSGALATHGEHVLMERLDLPPALLAGVTGLELARWSRRARWALGALVPVLLLLIAVSPSRTASAWRGLGAPLALLAEPSLPPLEVMPGTIEIPRGSPLELTVRAEGRDEVILHWQAAGDVARTRVLAVSEGRAAHGFDEVSAALEYWVSAPDGQTTGVHTVTPVDPLFVSDVRVGVVFPEHTGRASEEYRGEIPTLEVPVGSRLEVEGTGSRTVGAARLVGIVDPARPEQRDRLRDTVELVTEGAGFRGSFAPRASGGYAWEFLDAAGVPAALAPPPLEVVLVADQAPTVAITYPGQDTVLPLTLRQPLVIQAADDYGLAVLELVAWRVTSLGAVEEPIRRRTDLEGLPAALARPLLDLSGWELLPGDQVRYFARVEDNAVRAQESRTPEFVLRMPDAATLRRGAQDELERSTHELAELARRAREGADETRAMERQARAPDRSRENERFRSDQDADGALQFEARENLRRALEEQQAMAARVDSLREALGELSAGMQRAGVRDPELGRDLEELQSLLDEVTTPELRARLEELRSRLEEMNRTRAGDALQELADQEEVFRQRLEEALDRMRRAAAQQDFRTTAREAQELADQERALAEAMASEGDPAARAGQQEELEARAQEMEGRMERLAERLEELGEESAALGVEEARARAREAMQDMARAAESARAQRGREAGRQAGQASESLSEAAQQLQEAQQQMMEQRVEALRRALQQTAQDALALARQQGDIREAMRGASTEGLAELRADVSALEQGTRNMAENLSVASRAVGAQGAERDVGTSLGQAMGALEETVSALDGPSTSNRSPGSAADRAVDALNQVALRAMAASARLAEGGAGPGTPEQMLEALERLAQQQADVNNQASQMMPMQLGPEAMQQQMQQMAQGQQSVASELGELSDQEGAGPLGDLQALAAEAEALARELGEGRLEAETRQRQERLFHRLLDAGRSLEKEEFSDERESAAPGVFERGEVAPVDRDALGLLRFRGPDAEALRRLPPAARALVLRYFQRLNQRGGDPPPQGGRR
jgi:hypothetical protein